MSFEYVGVEEAIEREGLRMVVVGGIPSPWGEAAKGILHVKHSIGRRATGLDSEALKSWRVSSAVRYCSTTMTRRARWLEILMLAETLAAQPPLLPDSAEERAQVLGLSKDICGKDGLAWSRRLQLVHAALHDAGGFPQRVARYLASKYDYDPASGPIQGDRVADQLRRLADRLSGQRRVGSPYLVGHSISAADIYCATAMAMFDPLAQDQCAMDDAMRAAFSSRDAQTGAALAPILLEHRELMYARHLPLPLLL